MTTGLLSIGSSALNAAYTALRTTGNNIANVNTPGYSREITTFTPQVQTSLGNFYIGSGVAVTDVARVYNDFLAQQTNLAQASSSQADASVQLTGQVNGLFSDATTGLGAAIDQFFAQVQNLANQPASSATRQSLLSAGQQMTSQFNNVAGQLQLMSQGADQQLGQQISSVNTTVAQIASLNSQIELASASGATPNSLLDQRNLQIQTLNKAIGVTTESQGNGSVNLYLANGQPLLVGTQTFTLAQGVDPKNPQGVVVGISTGGGIAALDPNNTGGGTIGALLHFRAQTLPDIQNQVGRLAVSLSSQFNAIQTQGQDLTGAAGTAFFSAPAPTVTAAPSNPDTNSVSVTYGDTSQLQASDYRLTALASGSYSLTRLSDNTTSTISLPATGVDGMNIDLSASNTGTPSPGDTFLIQPVANGATNLQVLATQGSQIAAASPVQATLGGNNAGSLSVGSLALAPLPLNPKLTQAASISFTSPTQYTLTTGGTTTSGTYTPGQPITTGNGWSLTLNGTPANGDTVSIGAGTSNGGDNRNALLMTQLQSQGIAGGVTLDNAYSALVASVGAYASTATTNQASQAAILSSAQAAQSSVSGVNLDEEASKLMQYQQQYQAAAKLIQTATNVFDAIIAVAGAA